MTESVQCPRAAIGFARFLRHERDASGRTIAVHAVDGQLDWARVVAVQRWPSEDAVRVTLDSGLDLAVAGYFDEIVNRWKLASGAPESAVAPDDGGDEIARIRVQMQAVRVVIKTAIAEADACPSPTLAARIRAKALGEIDYYVCSALGVPLET